MQEEMRDSYLEEEALPAAGAAAGAGPVPTRTAESCSTAPEGRAEEAEGGGDRAGGRGAIRSLEQDLKVSTR